MDQSKDTTIHERGKIFWDCESLSVNPVFYNNLVVKNTYFSVTLT